MQNRARARVFVCESRRFTHKHDCNVARACLFIYFQILNWNLYLLVQAAVAGLFPFYSCWVDNLAEFSCYGQTAKTTKSISNIHQKLLGSGNGLAQVLGLGVDIESPPLIVVCSKIVSIYHRIDWPKCDHTHFHMPRVSLCRRQHRGKYLHKIITLHI